MSAPTNDDLTARLDAELASNYRRHALSEAARRVDLMRAELRLVSLIPDLPADLAAEARHLRDNGVKNLLWHLEQAMRPEATK